MGTAIIAQNSSAIDSGMRKFIMPASRGIEAIHFLSGSIARAVRNYAKDKEDASVVGTPVESANYMTFKGLTNFLQTKVNESASQTIFRVVRTADTLADLDHCPVFDSTYSTGLNLGSMLYGNTSGNINQSAARFSDANQTTVSAVSATLVAGTDIDRAAFSLIVSVVGPTVTTVYNLTKGTVKASATNSFGRRPSMLPFRIGSAYEGNSLYKGTCDMAFWSYHSAELTPTEVSANVARIRAVMQKLHGITI